MSRPRSYAAITLHSLEKLPDTLRRKRRHLGLSERRAAELIGIKRVVLHRVEAGGNAHTETLIKVFAWLDGGNVQGPGEQPGPQSTAQAAELYSERSTPAPQGPSTGPPMGQG